MQGLVRNTLHPHQETYPDMFYSKEQLEEIFADKYLTKVMDIFITLALDFRGKNSSRVHDFPYIFNTVTLYLGFREFTDPKIRPKKFRDLRSENTTLYENIINGLFTFQKISTNRQLPPAFLEILSS